MEVLCCYRYASHKTCYENQYFRRRIIVINILSQYQGTRTQTSELSTVYPCSVNQLLKQQLAKCPLKVTNQSSAGIVETVYTVTEGFKCIPKAKTFFCLSRQLFDICTHQQDSKMYALHIGERKNNWHNFNGTCQYYASYSFFLNFLLVLT